jgi:hypothetical protein
MAEPAKQLSRSQRANEKQRAQLRERASTFIAPELRNGEEIRSVVFGHTRPRGTYGLEIVIGRAFVAMMHWYVVVVTDRRLFLLDCGRARNAAIGNRSVPQSIVWSEPFSALRVAFYREGFLYTKFYVHRVATVDQVFRLNLPRTARPVGRQIVEALAATSTP